MAQAWTIGGRESRCSFSLGSVWLLPSLEVLDNPEHHWDLSSAEPSDHIADQINSRACGLPEFVAERFFAVPSVAAVAFQRGDETLHVWTILETWSEAQAGLVYDLEIELMERFPDIPFDFYVLSRDGRPIENLLRSASAYIVNKGNADLG